VEAALVRVDGYKSMQADVDKQQVTVTFDPKKTDAKALAQAIAKNTEYTSAAVAE
jgi:copper chaperone CopZ